MSCRELARQTKHLSQVAFRRTPDIIQERQALEVFLRTLPTTLKREVLKVDRATLKEACDEAVWQEELFKAEAAETV